MGVVCFCRSNLLVAIFQPLYSAVIANRACSYEIKHEDGYGGLKPGGKAEGQTVRASNDKVTQAIILSLDRA